MFSKCYFQEASDTMELITMEWDTMADTIKFCKFKIKAQSSINSNNLFHKL